MDFPACPVFEKNVEKSYRSVERAPRAAWRLATVLERADSRWFFLGGAGGGALLCAGVWHGYVGDPFENLAYTLIFLVATVFMGLVGSVIGGAIQFLAWHFSESNTASPGTLKSVLEKVSGDPRLEAVVQRWIDQRQARCVLQSDVKRLAAVTQRLEELRKDEARRLEGLQTLDLQLNCVSRYHANVRQKTLSARLPAPESRPPVSSRL